MAPAIGIAGLAAAATWNACLAADLWYRVPAGCTLDLTGYRIGEKLLDATAGTPDVRWFTVASVGVVASALVHGTPRRAWRADLVPRIRCRRRGPSHSS